MVATNLTLVTIVAGLVFAIFWLFGDMEREPRARLVVILPSVAQDDPAVAQAALPDRMSVSSISGRPQRD
jgi:hypothetical protein